MEVVRRDWTALAKQVQRELYQRLFTDQAVDVYLSEVVRQVRNGELDDALVYRKNLRKQAGAVHGDDPAACGRRAQIRAAGRSIGKLPHDHRRPGTDG